MHSSNVYSLSAPGLISIILLFINYQTSFNNQMAAETAIIKSHEYIVLNDFISASNESSLRRHFEEIGSFPRSTNDFSSKLYSDIGEVYEPNKNGECSKPETMLNHKENKCVFYPRMDVIKNFALTGGYEGLKEPRSKLRTRTGPFIKHQFNAYDKNEYTNLFESKSYIDAIRTICPSDHSFIKPIELNLAIQLPGQGLLAHTDATYFQRATRQTHPLWLLAVMKHSHLFDDEYIPTIQGVLYIGENNKKGGELYAYPDGVENHVLLIPPTPRSVVMMDGAEMVHGTTIYYPSMEPPAILSDKNKLFHLKFDGDNKWRVFVDDIPTKYVYSWDDIRASIPFRALCFKNEKEMNSWNEYETDLSIDDILEIFRQDLISKAVINENKWESMSRYEIGVFLRNQYIKLPSSEKAWIPWNYAVVAELLYMKLIHFSKKVFLDILEILYVR